MIKKIIEYYYNLYPNYIDKKDEKYIFLANNNLYHFELQTRKEEELERIKKINDTLNLYNIIIRNRVNRLVSQYANKNYVLIKIIKSKRGLNFNDVLNTVELIDNRNNKLLMRNNWGNLWINKIDNIEYQYLHLKNKYPLIDESLNYYIGMCETAISYFNSIEYNNIRNYISHIRVNDNEDIVEFYNPQNIIIDSRVRDVAEYLKSLFMNNYQNLPNIIQNLNKCNFNDDELKLLFCRLNYPSYYFDLYYLVINGKKEDSEIASIITKNKLYKEFLKKIYMIISKKNNIKSIEWVTK